MGFTKAQVMGLFIAVLMVGSILGVMTYTPQDNQNIQTPPEVNTNVTTLIYSASGVEANVLEIFPTAILVALTTEVQADAFEAKLRALDRIVSVSNGKFVQGAGANFRADIRLDSVDNLDEAIEQIRSTDSVLNVEIYPQALVTVPDNIELENEQTGFTRNHSFANSQTQAFVSTSTVKGDQVLVSIQAEFSGQSLSSVLVIEESNPAAAEQAYILNDEFEISSLENEFYVRSFSNFSRVNKLDDLKLVLQELDSNAQVSVEKATENTILDFSDTSNIFEQDLNTFLSNFTDIQSFTLNLDSNSASVVFEGSTSDYPQFKESLSKELEVVGWEAQITEPRMVLQGNAKSTKPEIISKVHKFSNEFSLESTVLQKAVIEADGLFIPDANTTFPLKDGSFFAFVKPEHSANDAINLSVFLTASERAGIISISAQES